MADDDISATSGETLKAEFSLKKCDHQWEANLVAKHWSLGVMGDSPMDALNKMCSRMAIELPLIWIFAAESEPK